MLSIKHVRTATAALVIAAAAALSGCSLLPSVGQQEPQEEEQTQEQSGEDTSSEESTPEEGADPSEETAEGAEGSDSSGGTESGSESGSNGSDSGAPSGTGEKDDPITDSDASDTRIKMDKNGYGTLPAAALEDEIYDLMKNKYNIDVTKVKCRGDLRFSDTGGSQNCDIVTPKKTYYGTVGVRDIDGDMIHYELVFPGLKDDPGFGKK